MSEVSAIKKYVAELLGTFVLVFMGCGSAVIAGVNETVPNKAIGYYGIAFAFGLSVLVMVYAIGSISGCHINPAITIAMIVAKKIDIKNGIIYIVMQCIGAIIGAAVLYGIASGLPTYNIAVNGLGQNGYGGNSPAGYGLGACFLAEVVLTFIFLIVIFGATSEKAHPAMAGVAIGLSLVLIHLVGIPITGTSVNPARSLGPAIFAGVGALGDLWLFWVAPIIGAVCAALVWKLFFEKKKE